VIIFSLVLVVAAHGALQIRSLGVRHVDVVALRAQCQTGAVPIGFCGGWLGFPLPWVIDQVTTRGDPALSITIWIGTIKVTFGVPGAFTVGGRRGRGDLVLGCWCCRLAVVVRRAAFCAVFCQRLIRGVSARHALAFFVLGKHGHLLPCWTKWLHDAFGFPMVLRFHVRVNIARLAGPNGDLRVFTNVLRWRAHLLYNALFIAVIDVVVVHIFRASGADPFGQSGGRADVKACIARWLLLTLGEAMAVDVLVKKRLAITAGPNLDLRIVVDQFALVARDLHDALQLSVLSIVLVFVCAAIGAEPFGIFRIGADKFSFAAKRLFVARSFSVVFACHVHVVPAI